MTDRREFLKQAGALTCFRWPGIAMSPQAEAARELFTPMKWTLMNGRLDLYAGPLRILKSVSSGYLAQGEWKQASGLRTITGQNFYSDRCGQGSAMQVAFRLGEIDGKMLLVTYHDGRLGCQLELTNNTATPIVLDRYCPIMTDANGSIELTGHPAEWRVYVDSGGCGGRCASYALNENEGRNTAGGVSVLWSPGGDEALAIGQVEVERSWTTIAYEYGERGKNKPSYAWAQSKTVRVRLEQDAIGYRLDPQESLKLDLCMLLYRRNPFHALLELRDSMVAFNNVREFSNRDAWVGWMTWYNQEFHLRGGFGATGETCASETVTLEQARFIDSTGLRSYGIRHIEIDDGYQRNLHLGEWLEATDQFPRGMKGTADALRQLGMVPGVWLAPFVATEDSSVYRQHPEWFVRYSFDWYHADTPVRAYEFDPTAPGALEWLLNVFRTFKEWGYWFFKNDFSGGLLFTEDKRYYNQKQTGLMRWRWAWRQIKQALGGNGACSLQFCGANNIGGIGIVDSVRTGSDVSPCVGDAQWKTIREDTATTGINRWWQNKHFFISDPDNLEVAEYRNYRVYNDRVDYESKWALSFDEARVRAALVVAVGGNIVLGDRLTFLEPERINIIKKTLPFFGESAIPLDMFEQTIPSLWWHHVDKPWGSWEVLSVVNFGETNLVKELSLDRVGLSRDREVVVWELWSETQHTNINDGLLRVVVKPHSVKTFRLTAIEKGQSVLVGSSFHLLMGAVEIVSASKFGTTGFAVRISRPAPEEGSCCFWSAEKQAVVTMPLKVGPSAVELKTI